MEEIRNSLERIESKLDRVVARVDKLEWKASFWGAITGGILGSLHLLAGC